jgi:hypothetical protein
MTKTSAVLLLWGPRVAGLALAAFLALFALDAFTGRSVVEGLAAFAVHLLPSALVLAIVAIAWRFQWIGGVAFIALAVLYAVMARDRIDWIAVISGPLVIVGALFLASWRRRADLDYPSAER